MSTQKNFSVKGLFGNYRGLPKSIYTLFVARIINRIGGFVHGFLALFLSSYLGMGPAEIGWYIFVAGIAGLLGTTCGGFMGDRFSRKKVYLMAQAMSALLFLPCALLVVTANYEQIPYYLIGSSFFSSMVRPVNTAMVADIVGKEDRKRAFSLLYLGINVGVAIAPFAAAILMNSHLVWFFLGDAITTFLAVILVGFFVKEHKITDEEMNAIDENDSEAQETGNILQAFFKRPLLIGFAFFSVINAMMYAQTSFAFPLLMKELFGQTSGTMMYAQLMSFNAVVVLVFTAVIHYLTDRVKPIYNIMMASLLYAVGMGALGYVSHIGWLYIATFIWTIGEIQSVTNQNVFLMGHTPINFRSRFMGIISLITSAGYIASPVLGGKLIELTNQRTLWTVAIFGGIIAAIGFYGISRADKSKMIEPVSICED